MRRPRAPRRARLQKRRRHVRRSVERTAVSDDEATECLEEDAQHRTGEHAALNVVGHRLRRRTAARKASEVLREENTDFLERTLTFLGLGWQLQQVAGDHRHRRLERARLGGECAPRSLDRVARRIILVLGPREAIARRQLVKQHHLLATVTSSSKDPHAQSFVCCSSAI